jgi:hypothetical protein
MRMACIASSGSLLLSDTPAEACQREPPTL